MTTLTKNKLLTGMTIITAILTLVLAGLLLFWNLYPYEPIIFNKQYTTEKNLYVQGEKTYYTIDYCKYTDIFPALTKKFVDGIEFTAEGGRAILEKGCSVELIPLTIPETLPAGRYHLVITLEYQMNPVRVVTITQTSNWFTVVESLDDTIDIVDTTDI